ncbi:MAG: enoyl-CoA hydratase/isomerase family protein [Candidatus Binatia bacterium]
MSTIRLADHDGGVRVLTLDRPPANALDESLLADLVAALDTARDDASVRALVVTGAGPFFSAGFDLAAPRRDAAASDALRTLYRDSHLRLLTFPKPTLALLAGHAVAGGLVLVLACDYRLGAEGDYKIGLNEVAIGASFPRIALEIVRLRLSHARAAELLLGAAVYPASQATRLGVVDELLPAETLTETVLRRATRMGSLPREAYAHTKAALVEDAVRRAMAEPPEADARAAAVWTTAESRTARARQRDKIGKGPRSHGAG